MSGMFRLGVDDHQERRLGIELLHFSATPANEEGDAVQLWCESTATIAFGERGCGCVPVRLLPHASVIRKPDG